MKYYSIYSFDPSPEGDVKRLVELFDNIDDANFILSALESVNINFNLYKIIESDEI